MATGSPSFSKCPFLSVMLSPPNKHQQTLSSSFVSKHLKGRLGPSVSDVTFFNHGGRLEPHASDITCFNHGGQLGPHVMVPGQLSWFFMVPG